MKNLYLGVALAPYRLDYYNYISEHMNCDIHFQLKGFEGQLFSTEELEKKCTFTPKYLKITPGERSYYDYANYLYSINGRPSGGLGPSKVDKGK